MEYISKNKIIVQFGLLKMRADLECLNLAFSEFTFYKNFEGKKLRPPRVFDFWLSCLAFLQGMYLLNAGLSTPYPVLISKYVIFCFWTAPLTA